MTFDDLQYPYAVLAFITLILLFWRPLAGLALLVAIFPMDPYSPRLPVPGINTETILLGIAFAMTVLRFGGRLPPLRYSGPVIAFIGTIGISFILAIPWAARFQVAGMNALFFIFGVSKSLTFSSLFFFAAYWWGQSRDDRQSL